MHCSTPHGSVSSLCKLLVLEQSLGFDAWWMSYGSGPQDDDRSMDFLSKVPRAQGSRGDVDKVC